MGRKRREDIPASFWKDVELFNPRSPPPAGTKVIIPHRNMVAVYVGKNTSGNFEFDPLYDDVRIDADALMRAFPPKSGKLV